LVRVNTWVFGALCLMALVVLLEGIAVQPSVVGVFGRARQRPLRWIAVLSWLLAIAVPLYYVVTGA
jgi:hypothetical protein